jgi:hypothetical protein
MLPMALPLAWHLTSSAVCVISLEYCAKVCLLSVLLRGLGYLDSQTLQEATTLLLLLLYDVGFKYQCTSKLLGIYDWLLQVSVNLDSHCMEAAWYGVVTRLA